MKLPIAPSALASFWEGREVAWEPPPSSAGWFGSVEPMLWGRVLDRGPLSIMRYRRGSASDYAESPVGVESLGAYAEMQVLRRPASMTAVADFLSSLGLAQRTPSGGRLWLEVRAREFRCSLGGSRGSGWEVRIDGWRLGRVQWFQEVGGAELAEPLLEFAYRLGGDLESGSSAETLRHALQTVSADGLHARLTASLDDAELAVEQERPWALASALEGGAEALLRLRSRSELSSTEEGRWRECLFSLSRLAQAESRPEPEGRPRHGGGPAHA